MSEAPITIETESDRSFDFAAGVEALRARDTGWLCTRERELTRVEREARVERMMVKRVLDERGVLDRVPDASVSERTARAEVEVARRLESQPEIAAAAHAGRISWDQLQPLVELATPDTDAEWARRGARAAPAELNRMARKTRAVSLAEAEARHRAREFRWWRTNDGDMLRVSGAIPDINGAYVEAVFEHMVNAMKPPKGQPWETRARRGADALVDLCRLYRKEPDAAPTSTRPWRPTVVVHMGSDAQPTVNGMPIAVETVNQLVIEGAKVREVRDEDPIAPSTGAAIPAALREYLKGRDTTCRRPGCERTFGLDAHHIVPRCRGGATDKHNVVLVCRPDHKLLPPHGRYVLEGDPEQPDGLIWRHRDEPEGGAGDARAGP